MLEEEIWAPLDGCCVIDSKPPKIHFPFYYCVTLFFYLICFSQLAAKEGARVIATDVNAEKLKELEGVPGDIWHA